MKRLLALVLCLALLLCGCRLMVGVIGYEDMVYTRPDLDAAADSARAAMEAGEAAGDHKAVLEAVWDFYEHYEEFMTAYDLAYIRYHGNQTDFYWQGEYEYCAANAPELEGYLEDIYCTLAQSPHREALEEEYFGEGWFEAYEDGGWYDDALVERLEQEQLLIDDYYDKLSESQELSEAEFYDAYALPLADVLAELVVLRQEIARDFGYDSYTDYAWDWYYCRDYTPAQAQAYLEEIKALVPLYEQVRGMNLWAAGDVSCTEQEVFRYVRSAARAMGGEAADAFRTLVLSEAYDISASEKKSGLSFELFLMKYRQPFVFVSGTGTRYDCLTFAHEFGHFCADHAAGGSAAGIDVMEVFSQAMELLSLDYAEGGAYLADLKLADSLCTFVEQAAYAAFEQALYRLPESELTAANILALYEQIGTEYGFTALDWEPRDLVTVPHFYSNPMYVISYVVSNDAAMQIYELEQQTPGAGLEIYLESLDTEQEQFLAYLEEAGLESPFGRVERVKALMEERFG